MQETFLFCLIDVLVELFVTSSRYQLALTSLTRNHSLKPAHRTEFADIIDRQKQLRAFQVLKLLVGKFVPECLFLE